MSSEYKTRILKFLVLYVTLVVAGIYVARIWLHYTGIKTDIETWGVFFAAFGTLYAIIIGFVLLESLGRYNLLLQTIDQEVNAVQEVRDFLEYLDSGQEGTILNIERALLDYVNSVIEREWPAMADTDVACDDDTSDELYAVIRTTNQIKVTNQSDSVALSAIINQIAKISTTRTTRICTADHRLPTLLQILLKFMSVVLITAFIFLGVQSVWVHYFMGITITISVVLAYQVLDDLAHPFSGSWLLPRHRFDRLAKTLGRRIEE